MYVHNKNINHCKRLGNHMGLSAIWKKIARQQASNCSRRSRFQFRPVVSAIFKKLHSKTCGYLLIIRHLSNKISIARGEAVLFLPACYFVQRAISKIIARFRYKSFILYMK